MLLLLHLFNIPVLWHLYCYVSPVTFETFGSEGTLLPCIEDKFLSLLCNILIVMG